MPLSLAYMLKAHMTDKSNETPTPLHVAVIMPVKPSIVELMECRRMPLRAAQRIAEEKGLLLEEGMMMFCEWVFG